MLQCSFALCYRARAPHALGEGESLSDILLTDMVGDGNDDKVEHSSPVHALKQLELKLEKKDTSIQGM